MYQDQLILLILRNRKRNQLIQLLLSYYLKNERRFWVHELYANREKEGAFNLLLPRLIKESDKLISFLRIDKRVLIYINKLRPLIQKKNVVREPISVEERVLVTLRFLATGESYNSLNNLFRIAPNTISLIVTETCNAINEVLGPLYLRRPSTDSEWLEIANEFEEKWNFKHLLGAIDGKHINIKKVAGSGSYYHNYKGFYSIVLMACCDANYCFTSVEIGMPGSISDGGVWRRSTFRESIENGSLNLPIDNNFPYVFCADEAFPLTKYLMKPFPRRQLDRDKRIFNYRLSRARRCIENTFGILAHRFRILLGQINTNVENAKRIAYSCCVLHNLLRKRTINYANLNFNNSLIANNILLEGEIDNFNVNPTREAIQIRNNYMIYFMNEGAIDFQNDL